MDESHSKPTREERLAAKLRENLRRRKAQSRAFDARTGEGAGEDAGEDRAASGENAALPKGPANS